MDESISQALELLAATWVARSARPEGGMAAEFDDGGPGFDEGKQQGRDNQLNECAAQLRAMINLLTP